MRKYISGLAVAVMVAAGLLVLAQPAEAATTCNSHYVSISHTFVVDGSDNDANGNFVWWDCNVSPGKNYVSFRSTGGSYNHHNTVNCGAGPSFTGLKVTLVIPGADDINVTIPCREDGTHSATIDHANRNFYASTPCAYANDDLCKAVVDVKIRLTLMWDFGVADNVWTSGTRTLIA